MSDNINKSTESFVSARESNSEATLNPPLIANTSGSGEISVRNSQMANQRWSVDSETPQVAMQPEVESAKVIIKSEKREVVEDNSVTVGLFTPSNATTVEASSSSDVIYVREWDMYLQRSVVQPETLSREQISEKLNLESTPKRVTPVLKIVERPPSYNSATQVLVCPVRTGKGVEYTGEELQQKHEWERLLKRRQASMQQADSETVAQLQNEKDEAKRKLKELEAKFDTMQRQYRQDKQKERMQKNIRDKNAEAIHNEFDDMYDTMYRQPRSTAQLADEYRRQAQRGNLGLLG